MHFSTKVPKGLVCENETWHWRTSEQIVHDANTHNNTNHATLSVSHSKHVVCSIKYIVVCFCCDVIESCSVVCVGEPWLWGVSDVRLAVVHRHKQTLAHLWELEGASKNRAVPESMMYSMWWIILFSKGEGCHSSVYVWPYDTWFTFSTNAVFFFVFSGFTFLFFKSIYWNLFILSIYFYWVLFLFDLFISYIYLYLLKHTI